MKSKMRVLFTTLIGLTVTPVMAATGVDSGGKSDLRPNPGWSEKCSDAAKPQDRNCTLSRAIINKKNRRIMLGVTLRVAPPDRKPSLKLIVPLGIYLPAGITLTLDGENELPLKLDTCTPSVCLATVPLDGAFMQRLRRADKLAVVYQTIDQKPINMELPLGGFARAYDRIK